MATKAIVNQNKMLLFQVIFFTSKNQILHYPELVHYYFKEYISQAWLLLQMKLKEECCNVVRRYNFLQVRLQATSSIKIVLLNNETDSALLIVMVKSYSLFIRQFLLLSYKSTRNILVEVIIYTVYPQQFSERMNFTSEIYGQLGDVYVYLPVSSIEIQLFCITTMGQGWWSCSVSILVLKPSSQMRSLFTPSSSNTLVHLYVYLIMPFQKAIKIQIFYFPRLRTIPPIIPAQRLARLVAIANFFSQFAVQRFRSLPIKCKIPDWQMPLSQIMELI